MHFEPKSLKEYGEHKVLIYWPKLTPSSYHITSLDTIEYNCVAWVDRIKSHQIDFSIDEEGVPVTDPYYLTPYPYIEYFESLGFVLCNNAELEEGVEKIAIFEKDEAFKHVASQLSNGHWTSKIGEFEDIEHYTLEAVEGHPHKTMSYGRAAYFMKRNRPPFAEVILPPIV